jgi:hypothetical protein
VFSSLIGNYEGLFRNDNGQSDPNITSLFDLQSLLANTYGRLPNDRPHQFKVFGAYTFDNGLNVGIGSIFGSGRPLTAMAANPAYDSGGEIPEGPRGSGIETVDDGFRTRTPMEIDFNLQASYPVRFGQRRLVLLADMFNVFNLQRVRDYDNTTEIGYLTPNPDFGQPANPNTGVAGYQDPFQLRFGVRFEF